MPSLTPQNDHKMRVLQILLSQKIVLAELKLFLAAGFSRKLFHKKMLIVKVKKQRQGYKINIWSFSD